MNVIKAREICDADSEGSFAHIFSRVGVAHNVTFLSLPPRHSQVRIRTISAAAAVHCEGQQVSAASTSALPFSFLTTNPTLVLGL